MGMATFGDRTCEGTFGVTEEMQVGPGAAPGSREFLTTDVVTTGGCTGETWPEYGNGNSYKHIYLFIFPSNY